MARIVGAPREAGTPGARGARDAVEAYLRSLGYTVEVQPFRFSPSSLWALPLVGAGLGWLALVLVPLLLLPRVTAAAALGVWLLGAASLGALGTGVGSGRLALPLGPGRPGGDGARGGADPGIREDANLIATRAPGVRRWIVAHLDSKAQGHSMAGRLVAVWLLLAAAAGLTGLAAARLGGPLPVGPVALGAGLALGAGALAGRGRLRGLSPGARDNASGVLAALAAARAARDRRIGVLITGAEEFGLVGARVFARGRGAALAGAEVVNLDTLDETGPLYLVSHDARGARLAEREAKHLAGLGLPIRRRRLPLGILVDSHPLARAGAAAITVARLDWGTLRRIHTPRDIPDGLRFETAMRVGRAVAG